MSKRILPNKRSADEIDDEFDEVERSPRPVSPVSIASNHAVLSPVSSAVAQVPDAPLPPQPESAECAPVSENILSLDPDTLAEATTAELESLHKLLQRQLQSNQRQSKTPVQWSPLTHTAQQRPPVMQAAYPAAPMTFMPQYGYPHLYYQPQAIQVPYGFGFPIGPAPSNLVRPVARATIHPWTADTVQNSPQPETAPPPPIVPQSRTLKMRVSKTHFQRQTQPAPQSFSSLLKTSKGTHQGLSASPRIIKVNTVSNDISGSLRTTKVHGFYSYNNVDARTGRPPVKSLARAKQSFIPVQHQIQHRYVTIPQGVVVPPTPPLSEHGHDSCHNPVGAFTDSQGKERNLIIPPTPEGSINGDVYTIDDSPEVEVIESSNALKKDAVDSHCVPTLARGEFMSDNIFNAVPVKTVVNKEKAKERERLRDSSRIRRENERNDVTDWMPQLDRVNAKLEAAYSQLKLLPAHLQEKCLSLQTRQENDFVSGCLFCPAVFYFPAQPTENQIKPDFSEMFPTSNGIIFSSLIGPEYPNAMDSILGHYRTNHSFETKTVEPYLGETRFEDLVLNPKQLLERVTKLSEEYVAYDASPVISPTTMQERELDMLNTEAKRQRRLDKNAESARLSRQRKKFYIKRIRLKLPQLQLKAYFITSFVNKLIMHAVANSS